MKHLLLPSLFITVSACTSNGPALASMSEVELAAYNRVRPPEKHVYCVKEADTSTLIRKRICRSHEDWLAHNERAEMTLEVLNSRPDYGLSNFIEDGRYRD